MDRSAGMLRLSRRLSDRFHVIRYDRRGYGRSAAVGPPFTVADNVDDLERLVEERTDGRGVRLAFGHSFGGNIVLALAERRPDLVERVAVYESPLSWLDWWPGETAGQRRAGRRCGDRRLEPAKRSCAASSATRSGTGCRRRPERPGAPRARRCSANSVICAAGAVGRRADRPVPVLAMAGEHARPHHRLAIEALPSMLADVRRGATSRAPGTSVRTPTPTPSARRSSASSRKPCRPPAEQVARQRCGGGCRRQGGVPPIPNAPYRTPLRIVPPPRASVPTAVADGERRSPGFRHRLAGQRQRGHEPVLETEEEHEQADDAHDDLVAGRRDMIVSPTTSVISPATVLRSLPMRSANAAMVAAGEQFDGAEAHGDEADAARRDAERVVEPAPRDRRRPRSRRAPSVPTRTRRAGPWPSAAAGDGGRSAHRPGCSRTSHDQCVGTAGWVAPAGGPSFGSFQATTSAATRRRWRARRTVRASRTG